MTCFKLSGRLQAPAVAPSVDVTADQDLAEFIGRRVLSVIDELRAYAASHGLSLNILDPLVNTGTTGFDPARLNIITDEDGFITGIGLG